MGYRLADYLDITTAAAEAEWRLILGRPTVTPGTRQVDYVRVETLLCLAAMLVVNGKSYGGSSADRAPTPVPELALLFRRPRTSITSKMANLDGSRPKGGQGDKALWLALHSDQVWMAELYCLVLASARVVGITTDRLPNFLHLEAGGRLHLLGQEEIEESALEALLRSELDSFAEPGGPAWASPTEKEIITRARIGQHRFALGVLHNCGYQCVFCGFQISNSSDGGLLLASHIKPWRDSIGKERLDVRNGVAACPTHDAAFDAGLLTFDADLRVTVSHRIDRATANPAVRTYFTAPMLRRRLALGPNPISPKVDYVRWHQREIFLA